MGRFKDVLPSQQGWLHELAKAEIHPEAERLLQLGGSFDPQQLVEESSVDFLTEMRDCFTEYTRIFNSYAGGEEAEASVRFQKIKVYSIAQSAADFMLFRNQVKLIVANSAHGVIQISLAQDAGGAFALDPQMGGSAGASTFGPPQDLLAQLGPFRDVHWTFQGEKVSAEQVAKFYFAEFTRVTRDARRSRGSNQLLLDQIKALLQQKGLDL